MQVQANPEPSINQHCAVSSPTISVWMFVCVLHLFMSIRVCMWNDLGLLEYSQTLEVAQTALLGSVCLRECTHLSAWMEIDPRDGVPTAVAAGIC